MIKERIYDYGDSCKYYQKYEIYLGVKFVYPIDFFFKESYKYDFCIFALGHHIGTCKSKKETQCFLRGCLSIMPYTRYSVIVSLKPEFGGLPF